MDQWNQRSAAHPRSGFGTIEAHPGSTKGRVLGGTTVQYVLQYLVSRPEQSNVLPNVVLTSYSVILTPDRQSSRAALPSTSTKRSSHRYTSPYLNNLSTGQRYIPCTGAKHPVLTLGEANPSINSSKSLEVPPLTSLSQATSI